jgi:hypothetical protein
MVHTVGWISVGISVLLSLKLIEMIVHIVVVWRLPRSLVDQLGEAMLSERALGSLLEQSRRAWDPRLWLYTHHILRLPTFLRRPAKLVFRWPVLMSAQALLILFKQQHAVTIAGCVLLVAGIWSELVQRFLFRLRLGYLDTYIRKIGSASLVGQSSPEISTLRDLDLVADFLLLFGRLVVVVILGYSAVYSAIELNLNPGSFTGDLGVGPHVILSLLYFSVVTLATVGYGDIVPRTDMARMLVSTEMLSGFVLLILLIAAFSITASPPRGSKKLIQ